MPLGLGGKGLALAVGEQPPMAGLVDTAVSRAQQHRNPATAARQAAITSMVPPNPQPRLAPQSPERLFSFAVDSAHHFNRWKRYVSVAIHASHS